jgi:hypothetical protein
MSVPKDRDSERERAKSAHLPRLTREQVRTRLLLARSAPDLYVGLARTKTREVHLSCGHSVLVSSRETAHPTCPMCSAKSSEVG